MSKVKHFIRQSWLLIIASFFFGLLIALTNAALSPRITQNEKDKLNNLMKMLINDASDFQVAIEKMQVPLSKGKIAKTTLYKALDNAGGIKGFAFVAAGPGFADKIKLVIAVDANCKKSLGFKVLASNETPGFGSKIKFDYFGSQFINAPAAILELTKTGNAEKIDSQIVAISGATVSSEAVVKIFNNYIDNVKEQLLSAGLIKK